jgi:tripartite-type tricarboxylate transporter receptor subunit TctC
LGVAISSSSPTLADDFYKDRSINVVIATNPGSGYDIYARLLITHMGKHIPGSPSLIPRNMIGAGGLRAAEYVYRVAPKDGTTIATVSRGLPFDNVLGRTDINIDPLKLTWLGSMNREISVAFSSSRSGVKDFSDLKRTELLTPGTGAGADSEIMPIAFNNLAGTKFKIVKGYKGTAEAALAVERGELDGIAYWSFGALKTIHAHWVQQKSINILFHTASGKFDALPDTPSILDLIEDETDRSALKFILAREALGRPFFTSPEIPAGQRAILRTAFSDTMNDQKLISEARERQLDIELVTGEQLEEILKQTNLVSNAVLDRVRQALQTNSPEGK